LLPYRPDSAYAAQLGYGFELSVSSYAAIAFEADYTFLYRDYRDPRCALAASSPGIWGSFIAARAQF
jgi:hypothetical protein